MEKFVYDIFDTIETPTFVLSNIYHHHIGVINNIDVDSINTNFNMASAQEMSFDVYKEVDGEVCDVWDSIVGLKYVFVPEFNEYYKADVTLNEDNKTVKSVTLTSAGEYELSNKKIVNLEINTESDILQEDYVTTVFYDENNPRGSLLDRVLNDKAPDWSIGHVDDTLKNIQRTFSINGQTVYDTLVNTIAKEINCLFTFDSVNRVINAYDLLNKCSSCGYRGEFLTTCPKCGGKEFIRGYGENSNILINYNNYSEKMTVDGGEDKVKNCFKVTGGDDNMNGAIRNCNPNGSHYIYSFSDADYEDMPPELVQKLIEYGEMYEEILPEYEEVVAQYYNNLNCYHYYKTTMMPRLSGEHWEANKGYNVGDRAYVMTLPTWCYLECVQAGVSGDTEFDATRVTVGEEFIDGTVIWQARKNIIDVPSAQQSLDAIIEYFETNEIYFLNNIPGAITEVNNEVKNIAALQINNIFRIEIILDDDNKVEGNIWTGRIKVYNTGNEKDTATSENPVTVYLKISSEPMDYINYMSNKVEKRLNKKDVEFTSIFDIEIPRNETTYEYLPNKDTQFKEALTGYGLDWLSNFSKSYQGCIETLISNGVTDKDSNIVGYELYDPMYVPYYERMKYINNELAIRQATVNEYEALYEANEDTMLDYHKRMDMRTFLGDDLYKTLYNYIREDDYNNTNYISDGLSDGEILQDARTLLELANDELLKANTLQYTLSDSLENLLNTEEFKDHKDKLKIGDYLICEADEKLYRLRLIGVSYGYSSPDKINVTFSNYVALENYFSDAQNILATAKSMSTSYGAVMHQVDKSANVTDEVTTWMEDSLSSAVTTITNNDNEEVTIDENGIIAREFDDVTGKYSDEQLRITHNIIAFTDNAWKDSTLGLGKQLFKYYSSNPNDPGWKEDTGYGLNAKFVNSGYIYGTQIVAGEMYSENYDAGHYGSHINLNDGSFDLAGGGLIGRWNSDTHSYDLNYTGDVEGVLDVGVGSHLGTWTVYDDGLYSGVSVLKPNHIYVTGNVRASDFQLGNTLLSSILDKKQAKLNAGTNITLTPEQDGTVTISAAGGGGTGDVNLYYGVTTPSDSLGDNKDLYVQLTPDPSGMVNSLTYQTARECNSRSVTVENNIFTINANWYVDRYEHAFLGYRIDGLTSGEEYTISFTARFKNAVEIPGYSELVGLTVQNTSSWDSWSNPATNGQFEEYHSGNNVYYFQSFPGDTTKHNYSFTFTASSSNYLFLYPDGIRNDTSVDMEITNLFISDGTISDNILKCYVKIEGEWLPYNTGLKYWEETSDNISRVVEEELPDSFTAKSQYIFTDSEWKVLNQGTSTVYRSYKKQTGRAVCGRFTFWDYLFGVYYKQFYGYAYISTVADSVKYSEGGSSTPWGTKTINGVTFYVSSNINMCQTDAYDLAPDSIPYIGDYETYEDAVDALIELADIKAGNKYQNTGIGIDENILWGGTRYNENDPYPFYVDDEGNIHGKSLIVDSIEASSIEADSIEDDGQDILSNFVGATTSSNGAHGLVPAPIIADKDKFLCGDGTWRDVTFEGEDIFSIFDTLNVSSQYSVGSLTDHNFDFSVNETDSTWSASVTLYNNTAFDLTDYDKLKFTVNIRNQSDYGAFWVTFSTTKYTWGTSSWVSAYANVDSAIKITESGVYEVDVSSLTGNYYIYIGATTGKDTVAHGDCNNFHNGLIGGTVTGIEGITQGGIVPNPTGIATDKLKKVKISGDIYEVADIEDVTEEEYSALPSTKNSDNLLYMVKSVEDIFDGGSSISLLGTNGITLQESSVSEKVGTLSAYEYSAGFEGFNIALKNLTVGHTYKLEFDFQFTSAQFIGNDYRCAYLISATQKTNYSDYTQWVENLSRDLAKHHHSVQFTASATTMYVAFNLCGCSDSVNNYFTMSDIYVIDSEAQNKIMYNGNQYGASAGGGGSSVIANPSGTATATLNKVEIDNVIYQIPAGGGGGGFTSTTLYTGTQRETTINLSDDYTNYDYLLLQGYAPTGNGYFTSSLVLVNDISIGNNIGISDDVAFLWYVITDTDTFTYEGASGSYYITSIQGLTASSGGGGNYLTMIPCYAEFDPGWKNAYWNTHIGQMDAEYFLDFYIDQYQNDKAILGNSNGASKLHLTMYSNKWYTSTGSGEVNFGNSTMITGRHTFRWNTVADSKILFDEQDTGLTCNGTEDGDINIYINNRGSNMACAKSRMYEFKITAKDGTVLHDFKPFALYAGSTLIWKGVMDVVGGMEADGWFNVKEIPGGGTTLVGVDVEANPSDSATDTLNTIRMGDTVYSVGGGNVDDVYVNGESVLDTDKIAQVKTHKEVSLAEYEDANDDIIYFVDDDDDDELGIYYSPIIYSTEEREVGTWTDGKPLYQRTWVFSTAVTISSNSWQATNIAVADTKIEFITKCKANNTDGQMMNYISATTDNATQTYVMLFNSRTNASMDVKYLTLEYTKSTDTPGSAKYNALGVPMVHYSTDEQVIGTWIDGKPIYRKIYDWTASPFLVSTSWQNTDIDSTNIDRIIGAVGMHQDGTLYSDTCADPTKSSHTRVGIKAWADGYYAYLILEYTKTTD